MQGPLYPSVRAPASQRGGMDQRGTLVRFLVGRAARPCSPPRTVPECRVDPYRPSAMRAPASQRGGMDQRGTLVRFLVGCTAARRGPPRTVPECRVDPYRPSAMLAPAPTDKEGLAWSSERTVARLPNGMRL